MQTRAKSKRETRTPVKYLNAASPSRPSQSSRRKPKTPKGPGSTSRANQTRTPPTQVTTTNPEPSFTVEVDLETQVMENIDNQPNRNDPPRPQFDNDPPPRGPRQDHGRPQVCDDERPVGDYITPTIRQYESPIYLPEGEENEFEVKSGLIHMITADQYDGYGNPNPHLERFVETCRTYKSPGVSQELIFMKVFPLSLSGRAKSWLMSHEPNTFRTWDSLALAFVTQFFPPSKAQLIKDKIREFTQFDDESFHEAYERYKGLQRECPHHGFKKWDLLANFYNGMDKEARSSMDQASGGGIMNLTATEGFKVIEKLARNSHQWGGERNNLKKKGKENTANMVTKEDFNNFNEDC